MADIWEQTNMALSIIPTKTVMCINGRAMSVWAGFVPVRLGKERFTRSFISNSYADFICWFWSFWGCNLLSFLFPQSLFLTAVFLGGSESSICILISSCCVMD